MKNHYLAFPNWFILLLASTWIIFTSIQTSGISTNLTYQPQAGFAAPPFALNGMDGSRFSLEDFQAKPVIVNVWASWCTPCKAEMPALEEMYQRYGSRITILAVNSTTQDSIASITDFVQREGLTFPILLDVNGVVTDLYRVQALPTTFFINPNGIIEEIVIGGPMSIALLEIRIKQLLGER